MPSALWQKPLVVGGYIPLADIHSEAGIQCCSCNTSAHWGEADNNRIWARATVLPVLDNRTNQPISSEVGFFVLSPCHGQEDHIDYQGPPFPHHYGKLASCHQLPQSRIQTSPSSNLHWQNPVELTARVVFGQGTSLGEELISQAGKVN